MKDITIYISDLLKIADAYLAVAKIEDKTLSGRVFADGKKLTQLRNGGGITIDRWNAALQWFSDSWPEDATWPEDIVRPDPAKKAEPA